MDMIVTLAQEDKYVLNTYINNLKHNIYENDNKFFDVADKALRFILSLSYIRYQGGDKVVVFAPLAHDEHDAFDMALYIHLLKNKQVEFVCVSSRTNDEFGYTMHELERVDIIDFIQCILDNGIVTNLDDEC